MSAAVAAGRDASTAGDIHSPDNPSLPLLQQPAEVLATLPTDAVGNPDWMATLDQKLIAPRTGVTGMEKMLTLDLDIVMKNTGTQPHVRFRHQTHTRWLTCSNCHPAIFLPQAGAAAMTQEAIVQGQKCGVCHGSVAFPATDNCRRCHSVSLLTQETR